MLHLVCLRLKRFRRGGGDGEAIGGSQNSENQL